MLGGMFSSLLRKPRALASASATPPESSHAPPDGGTAVKKWLAEDVHPPFAMADLRADPRRGEVVSALAHGSNPAQAQGLLRQLLAQQPESAVDRLLLVEVLLRSGDLAQAQAVATAALADPGPMGARAAAILAEQAFFAGDMQRARELAQQALAVAPDAVSAHVVLACALDAQGSADEACYAQALVHHRRALALRVDSPMPRNHLAGSLLRQNHLREGLAEWVMAEILGGIYSNRDACPVWAGQPLGRQRLLVHAHSGFGDMVLHLRFAGLLRAREPHAHLALLINRPMARLAEATGWFDVVHRDELGGESFDWQVTQTQLPLLLGVETQDLLSAEPYLRVAPQHVEAAAARLPPAPSGRLRVGLRWAGSSSLLQARRNTTLAACAPFFDIPGIDWVALVDDAQGAEEARRAGLAVAAPLPADFYDTAALMSPLDLIVSVDTAVANIGGALRLPTFLMCRADADWRWGKSGRQSPWYSSARVFRHPPAGLDWNAVIGEVSQALREWVEQIGAGGARP